MSDELRQTVLSWLPPNVRDLLDQIEIYAKLKIEFQTNNRPISPTNPNPDAPATEVWADRAVIYLRNKTNQDPQGILHELFHIQRYWVKGVPQVVPVSSNLDHWQVTSSIENDIEHLIIVPLEKTYGFDPYPYWNSIYRSNWERYPWPGMDVPFARKKNCLLGWLGCQALCTDQKVIDLAREAITKEGCLAEAKRFSHNVNNSLQNKAFAIGTVVRALGIPRHEVQLMYYDVKSRQRRIKPVPKG